MKKFTGYQFFSPFHIFRRFGRSNRNEIFCNRCIRHLEIVRFSWKKCTKEFQEINYIIYTPTNFRIIWRGYRIYKQYVLQNENNIFCFSMNAFSISKGFAKYLLSKLYKEFSEYFHIFFESTILIVLWLNFHILCEL